MTNTAVKANTPNPSIVLFLKRLLLFEYFLFSILYSSFKNEIHLLILYTFVYTNVLLNNPFFPAGIFQRQALNNAAIQPVFGLLLINAFFYIYG
jgi:hypothetical protein